MKRLIAVLFLMTVTARGWAQCPPPEGILAFECTGPTSDVVHFVLSDGTGWIDQRTPATFNVSGLSGTFTLGNSAPIQFTIGTSASSARFQVFESVNGVLQITGQCLTTFGDHFTNFPASVVAVDALGQMRSLQVSSRNPLFCREATRDILCCQVKGQVGGPFPTGQLCQADRVEFVCGEVQ